MIKNNLEYRVTKSRFAEFEREVERSQAAMKTLSADERFKAQLYRGMQRKMIRQLQAEVREYEELSAGKQTEFECATLAELPQALIKARIARRWTVEQFGARMGWKKQQAARYEAQDYQHASLARVLEVADVLGVTVRSVVSMKQQPERSERMEAGARASGQSEAARVKRRSPLEARLGR